MRRNVWSFAQILFMNWWDSAASGSRGGNLSDQVDCLH